jgi:serine/threonine protein kinase
MDTEDYMAPEMKKQKYASSADIWSLGCILYELMSLKHRHMAFDQVDAVADDNLQEFEEELRNDMKQVRVQL